MSPLIVHSGGEAIISDSGGKKLLCIGTTVPTDGAAGYKTGCLFMQTDGGDGTSLYVNEGSETSCNFDPVTTG